MRKRIYFHSRRTYFPRLLPMILLTMAVLVPIQVILRPTVLVNVAISIAVPVLVVHARLWIWGRRHPKIPGEERIQAMRDAAMWN